MVAKLYQDKVEGRLDDDRFSRLTADLERESSGLKAALEELSIPSPGETIEDNYQRFFQLAR